MKFRLCLLAAAALLAPVAAHAAQNLVLIGGFETASTTLLKPDGVTPYKNFELTVGNTFGTVTNWATTNSPTSNNPYNILFTTGASAGASQTSSDPNSPTNSNNAAITQYGGAGSQEYLAGGYNQASPDGGNFMALDGDPSFNGNLSQTVGGLTTGRLYELDFYWAVANIASRSGAMNDYLSVSFGSSTVTTPTMIIPAQPFQWVKQTYYFTAQSTSQLLSFLSIGSPAGQPPVALLDGVSLTAAPEPSALALLATGIGALAFFSRRRRPSGHAQLSAV